MKWWAAAVGAVGVAGALTPTPPAAWFLVVAGDTDGYLSPCGCTAPMTGGIRRRATAIRDLHKRAQVAYIETGGLGGTPGRQAQMKAETAAQAAAGLGVAAINLTERDAALGMGTLSAVADLSGGRLLSTAVEPNVVPGVVRYREEGPFLFGGAVSEPGGLSNKLGAPVTPPEEAAQTLVAEAKRRKKVAVLMLSGDRTAAEGVAKAVPGLGVVVYRASGDPDRKGLKVGETFLVTPGERGKYMIQLSLVNGRLGAYSPIKLGPEYADDPATDRIYRTYLRRVEAARLLEKLPRAPSAEFAGAATCGSCHAKAMAVWKKSAHSHALTTLEKLGHGRDPDCVECHVTGLQWQRGFQSRVTTPQFAYVGCESCHGAGKAHALNPAMSPMPKVGSQACASCHLPDQSPNFRFSTYWPRVSH